MRRLARLRQSAAAVRLARALWIIWAIVVWNVVFDHVIVVAGRNYIHAAGLAAAHPDAGGRLSFAKMDDWMRPAVTHGLWIASGAAGAILVVGLAGIHIASNR
jgi:hypothetical protein